MLFSGTACLVGFSLSGHRLLNKVSDSRKGVPLNSPHILVAHCQEEAPRLGVPARNNLMM